MAACGTLSPQTEQKLVDADHNCATCGSLSKARAGAVKTAMCSYIGALKRGEGEMLCNQGGNAPTQKNISTLRRQMVFVCIHWKEIRIMKRQTIVFCLFSAYNKRKNVELCSWLEKSVKTIYHCSQPSLFFKRIKISEAFTPRFALEPGVWSKSTL